MSEVGEDKNIKIRTKRFFLLYLYLKRLLFVVLLYSEANRIKITLTMTKINTEKQLLTEFLFKLSHFKTQPNFLLSHQDLFSTAFNSFVCPEVIELVR